MSEQNIVHGQVSLEQLPNTSLGKHLLDCITLHGSKPAQTDAGTGKCVTFADMVSQSRSISEGLRRLGVRAGDVVVIASKNRLEFGVTMLGTLYLGATVAPINPGFDSGDMKHLVSLIKPRVVVCEPTCHTIMDLVKEAGFSNISLAVFEEESFRDLLSHNPAEDFEPVKCEDGTLDVAVIMCSSGTTGYPKGVMITHRNLHTQMMMLRDVELFENDVFMAVSAAFWVSGMFLQLLNMERGTSLVLLPTFTAESFLEAIQKYKATFLFLGPSNLVEVAMYAGTEKFDVSSLRSLCYGGAAMSKQMHLEVERKLKLKIAQVYGLTEVLGVCMANIGEAALDDISTVGKLSANTSAKVLDLKTGEPLGPNQEGELCFRSNTTMKGYLNNPEATKEVVDPEGWFHTGDVGYYNEEGYFYIVDRIKELIKYKGVHIVASEIEGVLLSHPDVVDAAVVGVHHDLDQEHAVGCVVLQPGGATVTEQELLQLVADNLSGMKHLYGGLRIFKELPKTGSGKTNKRLLRMFLKQ